MMQTYATHLLNGRRFLRVLLAVALAMVVDLVACSEESLVVSGTLKHEETKQRLTNVTVSVLQFGEPFDEIDVDRNGKYYLDLPMRSDYTLIFSADGMISKRVAINSQPRRRESWKMGSCSIWTCLCSTPLRDLTQTSRTPPLA